MEIFSRGYFSPDTGGNDRARSLTMEARISAILVKHRLLLGACALAISCSFYFYLVFKYAVNVPASDDFEAILDLLNGMKGATLDERIHFLMRNHMEHRIVFCRIVTIADYLVFGKVNFVRLIFWGNLSMVGLLWVFYKLLPANENKLLYFVPIPFLFLNMQNYENAMWAMASLQNMWVVFFSLLAIYLLSLDTLRYLIGAIVAALFAAYTSGAGLFILIAGLVMLVLSKRSVSHILIWSTASVVIFSTYFINYVSPNPDFHFTEVLKHSPDKVIADFFAIAGSGLTFEKHYETLMNTTGFITAILAGYAISVLFFYFLVTKYYSKNPLYFSILVFFFITFLSVAVSRVNFGAEYIADAGRYKINSIALYVILYLIALDLGFQRAGAFKYIAFVLLSIVFWFHAYRANIGTVESVKGRLMASSSTLYLKHSYAGLVHWEPEGHAARILNEAGRNGFYKMPDLSSQIELPEQNNVEDVVLPESSDLVACAFDIKFEPATGIFNIDQGWAFVWGKKSAGNKIFIVIKSSTETKVFESAVVERKDVTAFFKDQEKDEKKKSEMDFDESGFNFNINEKDLKDDLYDVGVLVETKEGEKFLKFPGKKIDKKAAGV